MKSDASLAADPPKRGRGRPKGSKDNPVGAVRRKTLHAIRKEYGIEKSSLAYVAADIIAQLYDQLATRIKNGHDDDEATRLRGRIEKHTNSLMRILAHRDANTPKPAGDKPEPAEAKEKTDPFAGATRKHLQST